MEKEETSMTNLPTVSILMISLNDEHIMEDCLKSIYLQDYPPEKLNVVIVDGGSKDNTLALIKKTPAQLIVRPDLQDDPIARALIAVQIPRSEIILSLSADNRFLERDCLRKMMEPFADKEIVAVETLRYGYKKRDPILSRYFALIGGADPIAVGLGKADRGPYDRKNWHGAGTVSDEGTYYSVIFPDDISKIPTLGANGFAVRLDAIKMIGGITDALHIELCYKLIHAGFRKFGFIKDSHIVHYINISPYLFIKRRLQWAKMYSGEKMVRTYKVFDPRKDFLKLVWIILTYSTFIVPLFRAFKGFFTHPDFAWFLHPIMCFFFTLAYGLHYTQSAWNKIWRTKKI